MFDVIDRLFGGGCENIPGPLRVITDFFDRGPIADGMLNGARGSRKRYSTNQDAPYKPMQIHNISHHRCIKLGVDE